MENTLEQNQKPQINKTRRKWGKASYIISGLVWAFIYKQSRTSIDQIFLVILALLAGFYFYWLKDKLNFLRINFVINIIVFLILGIVVTALHTMFSIIISGILNYYSLYQTFKLQ